MHQLLSDPDGRVDLALAAAIWALAIAVYAAAAQLPPPLFDPLGSAAIPKLVSVVLAALAAVIVAQRIWRTHSSKAAAAGDLDGSDPADEAPLSPRVAGVCIAILTGYTAVMAFGILGFREATIPFVILLGGALSHFRATTMLILVPIAIAISLGFAWLFSEVLYIDLPVTRWLAP